MIAEFIHIAQCGSKVNTNEHQWVDVREAVFRLINNSVWNRREWQRVTLNTNAGVFHYKHAFSFLNGEKIWLPLLQTKQSSKLETLSKTAEKWEHI